MIKLLIGGSPCTHWSIAQKNNRETEPEGLGWELFKNYLIAKEKFKPDFFLYENNKSAAQAIKDQISRDLGVDLMYINSALVSAQNRQRFYAFNWKVEQPEDRGILLRDILETGVTDREKARCDTASIGRTTHREYFMKQQNTIAIEPVDLTGNDKAYALTTTYGCCVPHDTLNRKRRSMIVEPVRVGGMPRPNGEISTSQAKRVYSIDGKSVNLTANGGGEGAKTGMYAVPVRVANINGGKQGNRIYDADAKSCAIKASSGGLGGHGQGLYAIQVIENNVLSDEYYHGGFNSNLIGMVETPMTGRNGKQPSQHCRVYSCDDKSMCLGTDSRNRIIAPYDGKTYPVYEVCDGIITIKEKQYPIKLPDGFYIIRKLTPVECERLQTLPDGYTRAVSDAQRYKGLGNGWTAEVIIHILNGVLKDVPRDEEIVVLSMYDGIGTGRYCLDKMGFTNVRYYAYEIDKYAKQVAMSNYPDIIQCGDAFDIRHPDWTIGY